MDVGDKRVGIARGSSAARIAEPLKTVEAQEAVSLIASLAQQNKVDGIVVGLPRSLDGSETDQTKKVRDWAKAAQAQISLPFYWQDEALTSVIAQTNNDTKAGSDAVAASVILQDFLDTPSEQRLRC